MTLRPPPTPLDLLLEELRSEIYDQDDADGPCDDTGMTLDRESLLSVAARCIREVRDLDAHARREEP